jgi:hypothetical protein
MGTTRKGDGDFRLSYGRITGKSSSRQPEMPGPGTVRGKPISLTAESLPAKLGMEFDGFEPKDEAIEFG